MSRKFLLSTCVLALSAVSLPLAAQSPANGHILMQPPIKVISTLSPSSPSGILPSQFRAAYGFNQIPNQGQGMTIALVDAFDDPNIASDLQAYQAEFHMTPCNFQKVKVGNPPGNSGWGLEISLDVEQACAIAPQANIILVEANSNNDDDLYAAVQTAYAAPYNASTVSMSWGGSEAQGEQSTDSIFCNILNAAGQPVTFFASTGDGGHGTEYPSTSPCVIAVGGTTLALGQATPLPNPLQLNYGTERGWSDSSGGVSPYETQMSWQNPACSTWSTTNRCVPDIASVAQNIPVYDTYGYNGWVNVSGTSISSPDWASFMTLVNSMRVLAGKPTMSQAAQDLYTFYYSGNYATYFHDITTGTNGSCGSQCTASTGYDLVTGIGTYQANHLAPALVADPN
jgi:subtilase family serine protease